MKYLIYIITFLGVVILGCYVAIFTTTGNELLKPYIQQELQSKIKNKVLIESFTLRTNFLDLEVLLDDKSRIIINGDFSLLKQAFNLDYIVAISDIKSEYANIDGIIALKGDVKGSVENFVIKAEGEVFNAKTKLNVSILDKKISEIFVDAKGLHVQKVLALLKKPLYAKGFLDIKANLQPTSSQKFRGDGVVNINFGTLNSELIQRDFALNLPANITYRGDIKFAIDENIVKANSNIVSNILRFEGIDTVVDIDTKNLYSKYTLNIINLAYLKNIIGVDLLGSLQVSGDIKKTEDELIVNADSKTLGGQINATMKNEKATLHVKNIFIAELLKMLKQDRYSSGLLNAKVDVSNIKTLEFQSNATITDASINQDALKRILNKNNIPQTLEYTFELNAKGEDKVVELDSVIHSDLADIKIHDTNYDIQKKLLYGKYALNIASLEKLEFLIDKKLSAKLDTLGEFRFENEILHVKGFSDFLDAKTNYTFDKDVLNIVSNELLIQNLTTMLNYPSIFESYASLEAEYNLSNKKGKFNVEAVNGKLIQSEFTNTISALTSFDMTEEVYKLSTLKGLVDDKKIDFSVGMEGMNSFLKMDDGKVDMAKNYINTNFEVKVQNKDLSGTIKGKLNKPSINIKGSDYLKQKIDKEIDKHVPDEWKEPVKDLLKLFG